MDRIVREIPNSFSIPRRIHNLSQLVFNLWWVWNPEAQRLFSRIDPNLWEDCRHNPVAFLDQVGRPKLNAAMNDRYYLESYDRIMRKYEQYMKSQSTWFKVNYPQANGHLIGYFSFEFGLHESIPVYAGGLGILAGDHLKEASDLDIPMVGVGFYYAKGYFSQRITDDGWQETRDLSLNLARMPMMPLNYASGAPVTISVDLPERKVFARLWQVQVGRVPLILLDSNVDMNDPADRMLTSRLYSNDPDVRISQEIMLGIGGARALRILGYSPTVWHMNEGHSAFLTLERVREYIETGLTYEEAVRQVQETNVFTTHTPVPAGNDEFPLYLVEKYFSSYWHGLKMSREQFLDLARNTQTWGDTFSMPVLAFRFSKYTNAVSELHGVVSRRMWQKLWPNRKEDDVPITHITNGVHTFSWLARRMRVLYERYLGQDWEDHIDDLDLWTGVDAIPADELWEVRKHLKRKLAMAARERIRAMWKTGSLHPVQVVAGGAMIDPLVLTIGFARRFATYKRGYLILRNFDRLLSIINKANMPVQIVFAGKAHPADEPGKLVIQQVYRATKDARSAGRLIFLEDYDMNLARFLVQGVDVWLNTPRRPNEASGTSGMKAALNGVLNFSVLDGWWREGYNGLNGWAIGNDTDYADPNYQDEVDAESLYDTLENEIIPTYYSNRTPESVPLDWIVRVKESIRTLAPLFGTRRMLKEYLSQMYAPAMGYLEPENETTDF